MTTDRRVHTCARRLPLMVLLTTAVAAGTVLPTAAQTKPPNILLILIDDTGPEHLSEYAPLGETPFAETTELNDWIDGWVQFEHAWATPICSPTRVAIQTGRFGVHTGVGALVPDDSIWGLDPDTEPYVLAKVLGNEGGDFVPTAYTTAMFGKYHMGSSPGPDPADCEISDDDCVPDQGGEDSPRHTAGFDYYKVHHNDLQEDPDRYMHYWVSTPQDPSDEITVTQDNLEDYLTHATFQWFKDWCDANDCDNPAAASTPWFAYIAPFAAHAPLHCPPDLDAYEEIDCESDNKSKYYAMIQTLSIEIDALLSYLAGIGPGAEPVEPENTVIILAGDNGSPGGLSEPPFNPARAKGTVGEGGVRVPLWIGGDDDIVSAAGVVEAANGHFVQLLDLYPTVLDVAGGDPGEFDLDGVTLTPFFTDLDPDPPAVKEFGYVEWFYPNFDPDPLVAEGPAISQWAVRNATHKWVKNSSGQTALYRFSDTPLESNNLLADLPLDPPDQDAYDEILTYYSTLGFSSLAHLGLCSLDYVGAGCIDADECCSNMCVQTDPSLPITFTCQLPEQFGD